MKARTLSVRGGMFETELLEGGSDPPRGSGSPLLYLHGVRAPSPSDAFLDRLAERHHVIAPRLPGFGESTGSEHLLDLHDLIYYELDLLDALGLEQIAIAGHSLGAMIAAELAAVQPSRFSALVLIAPFGLWNPEYPVADFFTMSPAELIAASYHDPQSATALAPPPQPDDTEAYVAYMVERAQSLATAAKYLWPIPNRGLAKRLHRVAAPTLLIWGESDRIVPIQYAADLQAALPSARLEIIAAAGHLPEVEQPSRLAETIERFLGGLSG